MDSDRRAWAIVGWVVACVLICLAVGELAGLKYHKPRAWPSDLATFRALPDTPVDVAVVGSSRATFGLSPSAIDSCLQTSLGRETHTVNVAQVFADMFSEWTVARDLLVGARKPKVLVVEIAPEILNAHHHKWIYNMGEHVSLEDLGLCLAESRGLDEGAACAHSITRGVEGLAALWGAQLGGLGIQDTHHLPWMMTFHGGGQWCFGDPACEVHNASYSARYENRWDARNHLVIPEIQPIRFADYKVSGGLGQRSLERLIAYTEAEGMALVLVNMPVWRGYHEQIPDAAQEAFQLGIAEAVQGHGVYILDGNTNRWHDWRDAFVDLDHLGPIGAHTLSNQLCTDFLVPLLAREG